MHTFSYICNRYKIQIYIYKLLWFRTGHQSAFRESFDSERDSKRVSRVIWFKTGLQSAFSESFKSEWGFKTRFASHLVQNGTLQSAFCESFGSERGFKARFASHLIQNGASKRVSRVIWFRTGLQSAFRESFDSKRVFGAESNDSRNALWSPVLGFLRSPIFRAHQKIVELVLFTLIIMKVLQK